MLAEQTTEHRTADAGFHPARRPFAFAVFYGNEINIRNMAQLYPSPEVQREGDSWRLLLHLSSEEEAEKLERSSREQPLFYRLGKLPSELRRFKEEQDAITESVQADWKAQKETNRRLEQRLEGMEGILRLQRQEAEKKQAETNEKMQAQQKRSDQDREVVTRLMAKIEQMHKDANRIAEEQNAVVQMLMQQVETLSREQKNEQ
jgi:septal ring factor EnvC (AmiA/AmiB activator)